MASVPSTPHNQKRTEGPLASLVSTLRADNRDQLVALLSLDPLSNNFTLDQLNTDDNPNSPDAKSISVSHKNRLVFANENLRTLLVYHTLQDRSTMFKPKKNARRKQGGRGILSNVEESMGLLTTNNFGIVGTRVMFQSDPDDDAEGGGRVGDDSVANTPMGTETIYNPQNHKTSTSVFGSGLAGMEDPRDNIDGANVVLYFIHPTPQHIQAVSKIIRSSSSLSNSNNVNPFDNNVNIINKVTKHRIVFLPRINALSKRIMADENIVKRKDVAVHTLDMNLIPLEDDVITCLDMDATMMDCHVNGLVSEHVTNVAMSLRKVQDICGTIPRLQSFGTMGEMVMERTMALRLDEHDPYENGGDNEEEEEYSEIAAAIILDRKIDLITPLITPLTYEGLLDDVLKIESGFIKVEADVISPPEDEDDGKAPPDRPKYMHLPLNDLDTLYTEVRDQHVEKFGSFLQDQAKALKESHANFSDKNKDLTEIHQFVKQIPIFTQNLKSLTNHIHLAELVKRTTEQSEFRQRWQTERSMVESETCYDVIEDLIASQYPVFRLLRLLCLQSLTSGGIKTSRYDALKREVVQTYGYEYMFTLQNLEKMGLLRKRESMWDVTSPFATLRKQLSLIQADVDPSNPDDVSYVSSGYAPITARIIQTSMKGWTGKEEALRELPGRGIEVLQRSPPEDFATALKAKIGIPLGQWAKQTSGDSDDKPVLLIYFVGGLTYAEIASIRYMSKQRSFPYNIICCTTKIINGGSFLQSLQ
mmetsp:Transcript_21153/g.31103  ORF Transcript_21153/g.31103 Transcript_21153/m.31103 type:complete len:759 (-) Transcript_21153:1966-4242(-)|eukprot:CAMPEP_0194092162 /NCGR_PEP_ID=MMETSP0149-20130528/45732_1 /TAXON_ID=122233 /ORGANISM="Chaetoceros debilis, Strain MM31A-1" /LENGTH=758 /DNA_ID=CAMNT_0038777007 /DNA_START=82 /DNA_END=2358 /DNA_ORIENTATION=-